jgi:hypothetical protein
VAPQSGRSQRWCRSQRYFNVYWQYSWLPRLREMAVQDRILGEYCITHFSTALYKCLEECILCLPPGTAVCWIRAAIPNGRWPMCVQDISISVLALIQLTQHPLHPILEHLLHLPLKPSPVHLQSNENPRSDQLWVAR